MPTLPPARLVPPVSPYGTFTGELFQYTQNLVAFESAALGSQDKCILLGGLSDGLLPTPYTQALDRLCQKHEYSLIQPILSSSYLGFGNGNLERDTQELGELLWYLKCHRRAETFTLIGHSTGCQNIVHFLEHGLSDLTQRVKFAVLQAPVSDREAAAMQQESSHLAHLATAQELIQQNKAEEMMPRAAFWAPITAQRFVDLHQRGGADDFFSSDFSQEELQECLGHMTHHQRRVLVVSSGADEYVPDFVHVPELTQRLCNAMNSSGDGHAEPLVLPNANHNLSQAQGDIDVFVNKVGELLGSKN